MTATDCILKSIQVGKPQTYTFENSQTGKTESWTTGIFKSPVKVPVEVLSDGLYGDGQADLVNHGGRDKAILCYSANHYSSWQNELDRPDLQAGMFGENLTIAGLTESTVCIGDQFQIGTAILEVSQPRQPCWKLGRRCNLATLPKLVIATGRSGWYCRVIQSGTISANQPIQCLNRPHPKWTILRAHQTLYSREANDFERQELKELNELSAAWKADL